MSTLDETPFDEVAAYRVAAAKLRAEFVAKAVPIEGEIHPVDGWLRIVLSGRPIAAERIEEICGPSHIDIPEFKLEREKLLELVGEQLAHGAQ